MEEPAELFENSEEKIEFRRFLKKTDSYDLPNNGSNKVNGDMLEVLLHHTNTVNEFKNYKQHLKFNNKINNYSLSGDAFKSRILGLILFHFILNFGWAKGLFLK